MFRRTMTGMHRMFGIRRAVNEGSLLIAAVIGMGVAISAGQHALQGESILGKHARDSAPLVIPAERAYVPAMYHSSGLPTEVRLDVPFITQAPYGDWSSPYDEACEEASVAMAIAWVRGHPPAGGLIPSERADTEILRLVDFENYYFGYNNDTALRETVKLITDYYHYPRVKIFYDISTDDIRRALAACNIVILPVAGALLSNPNYISPPPYHMVVVKGYDDQTQEFIVNDPGTRHGEDYHYPYATLWNAIHDWTGSDETIMSGRKGMIVVGTGERK